MNGFVNLLKPSGMNSNYAVVGVRRLLPKGTKVGHMGTLDPAAAGVLPIGVGFGARLFGELVEKEKEYIFEATLGTTTDTGDSLGRIVQHSDQIVSAQDVAAALPSFVGDIQQKPPLYSAIVQNGKKLYALARAGENVDVPARQVHVESLELVEQLDDNRFLLKMRCGRGTYVRSICEDLGNMLGVGGYCSFLLRSASGMFTLDTAISLEEFAQEQALLPVDAPLAHYPKVVFDRKLTKKIQNGTPIRVDRAANNEPWDEDQSIRVYLEDEFVGLCVREDDLFRFTSLMPPAEIGDLHE